MTNSQAELDELKGRFLELDRFRSSLQKLTDEFTSLRQSAEAVLGRLREQDQFVDSRKDEVRHLLTAATDTIRTFEDRKEDLIQEIQAVLNQVQGSFNRLSSEIGTKAVETINSTSLQIFQLRKSLLDFTEKKSEELRAALSAFEAELVTLKSEHQQALGRLPAVGEQLQLVENRLKEMILSCQSTTESLRDRAETRDRETKDGLDRLDQRVTDSRNLLEQTRQEIGAALEKNRGEIYRLLGESHQKWDQLSAGHAEMRSALEVIESSRRQYERSLESLRREIEEGLRSNAEGISAVSASFGERVDGIQAEYRHLMGAMLERVEGATQDTERIIGVIRQEIENTLKESSDRISGFLISSEEKINELKLNHYQTRAAIDRLERSQQEVDRVASAARIEVSEAVREHKDLLSDFEATTNRKIEEVTSAHRRELDAVLSRLDMVRREGDSLIARAKHETERACKERLDQVASLFQTSEEKLDGLRSEQLSIRVSLDQVERSREKTDRAVAGLSEDLSEALRRTREEVAALLQGVERRLDSVSMDHHSLKTSLESLERSFGESTVTPAAFRQDIDAVLKTQMKSVEERYEALALEQRRELGALYREIEDEKRRYESDVIRLREELAGASLAAGQTRAEFLQDFQVQLDAVRARQDERIASLSGMLDAFREEHARVVDSLNARIAESVRQGTDALSSLARSIGEKDSEMASRYVALKQSLESLGASEAETKKTVVRVAEDIEALRREAAARPAAIMPDTQAIDRMRGEISETREELSRSASETGSAISALREEVERFCSATASQNPALRAETEAQIGALKSELHRHVDAILERIGAAARENDRALDTLRQEIEASIGETARRLSDLEEASGEQFAKASFERLKEVASLREALDRSCQDTAQLASTMKDEVERSLSRYDEGLSRLSAASDERFAAAEAAQQSLKGELDRLARAKVETDRDLATLKERIGQAASEAAQPLSELASKMEARLNETEAVCRSEVNEVRGDLAALRSEQTEAARMLQGHIAGLSALRDEVRKALDARPSASDEAISRLRSEYLKEIDAVLNRVEGVRSEEQRAVEAFRQEITEKVARETGEVRELLQGTAAQVAELKAGTGVITTVLEHVERLREDNEKTFSSIQQEVRQAVSAKVDGLAADVSSTQETVELLKSGYLELQAFMEGIEGYRVESEQAVTAFKEEIERQLRDYLADLGGQAAAPSTEIESIRAGNQIIQEKVTEVLEETKRIQGELQEEIQYRARETREQVTSLIERKTHQFSESFTTLVEHKDTMLKSAVFGAVRKQRAFTLLVFLLSLMLSFALFYFGKR